MTNIIRLLQISDIHAGELFSGGDGPVVRETNLYGPKELSREAELEYSCKAAFTAFTEMMPEVPPLDLLVVGGDIARSGLAEEHRLVNEHFLDPLQKMLKCEAVIVPGNHDANWTAQEKERLSSFHSYARGGATMDTPPYARSVPPLDANSPPKVVSRSPFEFLLFNSVRLSGSRFPRLHEGSPEGPNADRRHIDPAFITDRDMRSVRQLKQNNGLCRIAVLHHDVIPSEGSGATTPYKFFLNNGEFNHLLGGKNFKLVLHGHQHRRRLLTYADHWQNGPSRPEFVCVSAPSFGALESDGLGFNVITIEFEPEVAVHIEVQSTIAPRGALGEPKQEVRCVDLLLRDFQDTERKVFSALCRGKLRDAEGLVALARDFKADEEFFNNLSKVRANFHDIRAMYSLSVFSAKQWDLKRLADIFLPDARRNISRAAVLADGVYDHESRGPDETRTWLRTQTPTVSGMRARVRSGAPNLHFHFSTPVCAAIKNANEIASSVPVTETVRRVSKQHGEQLFGESGARFVRRRLGAPIDGAADESNAKHADAHGSLSVWDNVPIITRDHAPEQDHFTQASRGASHIVEEMFVSLSELSWTPKFVDDPKESDQVALQTRLLEFVRILVWDEAEFDSDEAVHCIDFHENCAFPLFWLRPDALPNRERIGHFTLFARHRSDAERTGPEEGDLVVSDEQWNDREGRHPLHQFGSDFATSKLKQIWRGKPPREIVNSTRHINEFVYLLQRGDLMFAADAWAIKKVGGDAWQALLRTLEERRTLKAVPQSLTPTQVPPSGAKPKNKPSPPARAKNGGKRKY